jgi:hypothetical protein
VFFGGFLPEGETAKNRESKFQSFPNESVGQNYEKLRIKIPNFPE